MPKFSTHVALMNPEYQPANFAPGDEVPEWALDQVGEHVLEPESTSESADADGLDESNPEQGDDAGEDADGEDNDPPPATDDAPDFTVPAPRRNSRSRK